MNHFQSELIIKQIITEVLASMEASLQQKTIMKNMPFFLVGQIGNLFDENLFTVFVPPDLAGLSTKDELLASIPRLNKDSLMPQDLSEEKVRASSPDRLSPRSSCSSIKKITGISRRSSTKLQDKLKSISFAEKDPKKPAQNAHQSFSRLDNEEDQEDVEEAYLRERTQLRLKCTQQERQLLQEKQKYYQARLKQFNEVASGNHDDITFDYEGDAMRSTVRDGKVRLHSVRAGMGATSRKLKEGFSRINAPQSYKIENSAKKAKDKQDLYRGVKQLEMPLFPLKQAEHYDVKNLKLQEYRKMYGKRYSRTGISTIEVIERAKTSKQDLFGDKKHLKEERTNTQNQTQNHFNEANLRKLALPRLHGKYKVLDRYQES